MSPSTFVIGASRIDVSCTRIVFTLCSARLIRTLTCLRDITRKSSFSRFIAVFMSYCPQLWGYRAIYNDLKTQYMFESYEQKFVVFVFMAIFMCYCPRFLGCSWIRKDCKTRYMFEIYD